MPTMKFAPTLRVRLAATGLVAALLSLSACAGNPAKDAALKRAAAARKVGDLAGEALALREACAADRKDADVCKRSSDAERNAMQSLRVAAKSQCDFAATAHDNMPQCLAAIAQGRKLATRDPDIEAIADAAGRSHAEFCNGLVSSSPPKPLEAIRLARCALVYEAAIGTPAYGQWINDTRKVASTSMLQLTSEAGFAGNQGATAVLLSAAACLAPLADLPQRAATAQATYADMMRPHLTLVGGGPIPIADICASTSAVLGGPTGRVACASRSKLAPQLQYEVVVDVSAVSHQVSEQGMSKQYVARIDRRDNPEYRTAARDEVFTREQLRQAEERARDDESTCSTAESALSRANSCYSCPERTEKERACNAADASKRNVDTRRQDAQQAANRLRQTPAIIEEKIWATAHWTVRTHQWSAPWRANVTAPSATIGQWTGFATFADSENQAVPEAEIAYDPLTRPDNGWQFVDVREQVAKQLAGVVDGAVIAEGKRQRANCAGPLEWEGGWLACWAASNWWMGSQFDGAALFAGVAASDADPRVRGLPAPTCR